MNEKQRKYGGYAKGGIVSALDNALGRVKRKKGSYDEYLAELRGMPGVKPAEIEQRLRTPGDVQQYVPGYDQNKLTPELFKKHFRKHAPPRTLELRPGDDLPGARDGDMPHEGYEQYTTPGGKNYREMLFFHRPRGEQRYYTNHYEGIPDILGHARLKDRTGPNGEKVLHVEEIQSDWHQKGRKDGYRTPLDEQMQKIASSEAEKAKLELARLKRNHEATRVAVDMGFGDPLKMHKYANQIAEATGPALKTQAELDKINQRMKRAVPDAPFKKDWHEMMLKHLLVHAAKNGYDAIAVTPGEEQAKRYDLSKHIGEVHYSRSDFRAYSPEGKEVIKRTGVRPEDLPDLIGKELADKLMAQKPQGTLRSLTGEDIKVGGEGMKGFYDKMIPTFLNKLGKPHGAQVGTMALPQEHPTLTTGHILDDLARRGHSQEQINNMRAADLAAHQRLMEAERDAQPVPTVNLHALPITDKMREDVKNNGLPLFAKGGEVDADKNLQAFLKDSKVKERMYHGTNKDFARFHRPLHGNFVSPDPEFANQFARTEGGNTMPVYVRAANPWDFDNPEHMAAVKQAAARRKDSAYRELSDMDSATRHGLANWSHIEHPDVQDIIKGLGHDSYYTREGGVKHLAIYDPHNIKSAIGNRGTFDPNEPDITKAKGGEVDVDTMRAALALRKKPKAAPQEAALEKARLNAVRLLGLPENNTPEDRAKALGFVHDFYHGTERMDRLLEKPYLDPKRATSGPMPYGTDNPVVASNYAASKADTSRVAQDEGSLEHYFQVHPKALGQRGSVPYSVERSFHFLPPELKQEIHAKAPNVGYADPEHAEGAFVAHPTPAGALTAKDHYDYILKREARGNPLTALRILFGDSGAIFGEEHKLADVFKAAGYPHQISQMNAPWEKAEGVFTGKVRARNPLYTHDTEHLQQNVIPALEKALARDRSRTKPGADSWDKNARYTPKDWLKQLKEDVDKGANSYVWTSIPDKVTAALKELGHDAIVDTGGKSEGATGHTVTIPFNPEQVRSRFAAYDPEKSGEKGLLLAQGGEVGYRGEHTAPGPDNGAPMHDVTRGVYPEDFYGPNGFRYYADQGEPRDRDSFHTIMRVKGKPEAKVWAFRAVPSAIYKKALKQEAPLNHMIRHGDWVTASRKYAEEHGEGALKGDYKIARKLVPASHLYTNGDSIHEWGYYPPASNEPDIRKAKGGSVHDTPEFKRWFGDSKVVDENGKPLVVYHGTKGDVSAFDPQRQGQSDYGSLGRGFYFSQSPELAHAYAQLAPGKGHPNVMPVHISMRNPHDMTDKLMPQNEQQSKQLTAALKKAGHDGVIFRAADGTINEAVAFHPHQIKSAIGNRGTFDPNEPDITKAQGGTVQTQNNLITTLAQRLGMTPAQVMQAIQQQQPQGLAEGGQPDKKRKKKKDGRLSLSDLMRLSSVGADEAPDLPIKEFTDPGHSMIPEGGVQMPNGAPFPIGPQQQAQAAQSQTGIPGQVQGGAPLAAIASMLHQGAAGAPQPGQQPGQGNMLALTHQGQAMQAMRPPVPQQPPQRPQMAPQRPGMPAMAKGGNVKMSTADMKRALQARKRTAK